MNPSEDGLLRWIPLLPLLAVLAHGISIGLIRRPWPAWWIQGSSLAASGGALLLSLVALSRLLALPRDERVLVDTLYTWIGAGIGDSRLAVDLGFHLDPLSAVLLLVVTGAGTLAHAHSVGIGATDTREDRGPQRLQCFLGLLIVSMLVLVLADNLVLLFAGWVGTTLATGLLVGFWYTDAERAGDGARTLVVGAIGDLGLLIAMLLIFQAFLGAGIPASLLFVDIELELGVLTSQGLGSAEQAAPWRVGDVVALSLLLAVGSRLAQIPFLFWHRGVASAPPVAAALIHAAGPALAGTYLACRLAPLFTHAPQVLVVMVWLGALGAAAAALVATAQSDLRRLLCSLALAQQGFVLLALGCGAFAMALFHLIAAGLTLCLLALAGNALSVALQGEHDLDEIATQSAPARDPAAVLPGLRLVFRVGVAVIAGLPLASVFFSRGGILAALAGSEHPGQDWLEGLALLAVGLTAFAACRLFLRIFDRAPARAALHPSLDPPARVLWPLYVLSAMSLAGGLFAVPQVVREVFDLSAGIEFADFLGASLPAPPRLPSRSEELSILSDTGLVALAGFLPAFVVYRLRPTLAERIAAQLPTLRVWVREGFHVERALESGFRRPLLWGLDLLLLRGVERRVLDAGLVDGVARVLRGVARSGLRSLHGGLAHGYLFFVIAGTALVVGYLLR